MFRRRGSDGRAERTTSGWENLLLQQGSEHVPHGLLQGIQAIKLTCLGLWRREAPDWWLRPMIYNTSDSSNPLIKHAVGHERHICLF